MRKIFEVMIYDKYYDVYDIPEKKHVGLNDEPKTWWVYLADRLPSNLLPPIDSDSWEPYHVGIKRWVWDIHFKQRNTTKEKWNSTQFNNHIKCEIKCNGYSFYEFGTFDMSFAMAKAQYLMTVMSEHPFNFFEPHKENGRKIWWYNLPATVVVSTYNPWEIRIKPDYTTGLTKSEWWQHYNERRNKRLSSSNIFVDNDFPDDDDEDNDKDNDLINWGDALSDGKIWWFRD